jgi:hypothetical protein
MMINQKNLHNKIDNNNNINTKTTTKTKIKIKQILLAFYVISSILILAFSIFSVQNSLGQQQQLNENQANNVPNTITNTSTTSFTAENKKPMHVPNQIIVVAEDIEEIRDNLQEARKALNNTNYLQVLSHINNIDKLLTAFVVSGSSNVDNQTNNIDANISNNVDSIALAHLNNSDLIKKYNELIKDFNREYNNRIVVK